MLGYNPIVEEMVILESQDFTHRLDVIADDPFPAGTTVTLYIYARDGETQMGAWPAVAVDTGGADLQIAADDFNEIPDSAVFRIYVTYPTGEKVCWYRGRVWRRR